MEWFDLAGALAELIFDPWATLRAWAVLLGTVAGLILALAVFLHFALPA